ncbi:hypothetical protein AcW1_005076 [Taiwanofungus camphoratus]|nr:hypothetical protein AcW1_005076 [Antrodia cinnamomea]
MATMTMKAGLDWVLNDTVPPEGSQWVDMGLGGGGWTLLCPMDGAFKQVNLTALYADEERLPAQNPLAGVEDVLYNNQPLAINDSLSYSMLHTSESIYGNIIFRELESEEGTVV